jgi:CheY-like chemotaxis protein
VSNAIKYTRQGSVALRCLHQQPSLVRIEVLDTGIGIPGDQLRYIYDEFYQVGIPTNSTREGYGLGLSIVQRLVALLDIKLDAHSQVGEGSRFALTLPAGHGTVHRPPGAAPEPALRAPHALMRVLLVEDDASVRDATRMLLKSDGYHVTAVASLAEALAHAAKDPRLDLLVTDYHLRDGETGMQVIVALREALRVPLRAILITGDISAAVSELRLDPHLRLAGKPIKAEELLGTLSALLKA